MKGKPRILYISAVDHPGAPNRILMSWLKWLNNSDYGIYVACPYKGWIREKLQEFSGGKVLRADFFIPNKKNLVVALFNLIKLCVFIVRHKITIVHCNSDHAYYIACMAARITRKPIVTHIHFHYSEKFYNWMFAKWRKPDLIILVSEAFKNEEISKLINSAPQVPIKVLHNCIDISQYVSIDPSENQGSGIIFYPAAIAKRKKQHQLYQLDFLLMGRGQSFELLAAGKTNEEMYWKKCGDEASKYPNNNVKFLGHIDSVSPYYSSAFLSVTLSNYETFGYSVLESMACGVPVVGYRVPAVEEVLGEAGILVEQDDLLNLAGEIIGLKTNKEKWKTFSESARERAKNKFSPEYICPSLIGLYQEVINRR